MKKTIILNHKSDLTLQEVKEYLLNINDIVRNDLNTIICPSPIYIPYFTGKYKFKLASQNISTNSLTGEITGEVLKSTSVEYVLIGHHDRKEYENSKIINEKIKEALKHNITPIVILGETYYQKELRKTGEVISKQLREYFQGIEVNQDILLVYAPNWSYKGKELPTREYVTEVVELIKNIIKRKHNANLKVLYGGHVTPSNVKTIDKTPNIDGILIEKSSTNIEKLKTILDIIE